MMSLPNWISVSRIFLVPVFAAAFFSGRSDRYVLALAVCAVAGLTDLLDGFVSRKMNQVSRLGIVLDPLADKVFLVGVVLCMALGGLIPYWILGVIVIKESLQILIGSWLWLRKEKMVIPANKIGKVGTVAFYGAVIGLLILGTTPVTAGLLLTALGIHIVAFISYGMEYRKKLSK